jgi:hypothetical protein
MALLYKEKIGASLKFQRQQFQRAFLQLILIVIPIILVYGLYKYFFLLLLLITFEILLFVLYSLMKYAVYSGMPISIYSDGIVMPTTWTDRKIFGKKALIPRKEIKRIYIERSALSTRDIPILFVEDVRSKLYSSGWFKPKETINELDYFFSKHYPEFPVQWNDRDKEIRKIE